MAENPQSDLFNQENIPEPDQKKPLIKWGWLRVVIYLAAWLGISYLLSNFVNLTGGLSMQELTRNPRIIYVIGFGLVVNLLLIAVFRKFIDRKSVLSLGLNFSRVQALHFVYGILVGIAIITAVFLILLSLGNIKIIRIQFPGMPFFYILIVFLMVAFEEELQSRGYILNNFMESMNRCFALFLTAILFSTLHMANPDFSIVSLINIILAGLVLGIYYVHKVNLWFPIGIHWSWNFFEGAVFGSPVSGFEVPSIFVIEPSGKTILSGGSFGFEASIVASLVIITAIILIHVRLRRSGQSS